MVDDVPRAHRPRQPVHRLVVDQLNARHRRRAGAAEGLDPFPDRMPVKARITVYRDKDVRFRDTANVTDCANFLLRISLAVPAYFRPPGQYPSQYSLIAE